jgi:hypothetical protein
MRSKVLTRVPALTIVLVLLIASLAGGTRDARAEITPLSVIEAATTAVNAGDTDAYIALVADDVVWLTDACFALVGSAGCVGAEANRSIAAIFLEDSLVWTWTEELQASGTTVAGPAQGSWGALAPMGIERVLFHTTWVVTDGKISHIRMDIDYSDPDSVAFQEALYASVGKTAALSVIERTIAAVNAPDIDGLMDLFTDDAVWEGDACFGLVGPDGCVGTVQIRAVMEAFVLDDFSWASTLESAGSSVSGKAEGSWGALREAGFQRVLFITTWEVINGKISYSRMETDISDPDSLAFQTAFFASLAPAPAPSGNAGLATTDRGMSVWPWRIVIGAAVFALLLSARWLPARSFSR